jgi:hypothetical protein
MAACEVAAPGGGFNAETHEGNLGMDSSAQGDFAMNG